LDGVRGFNEALYAARPIIEEVVHQTQRERPKQKYEYSGRFKANVAFCNLYLFLNMELILGMRMRRSVLDIMLIS
jgi:hypothetical protein